MAAFKNFVMITTIKSLVVFKTNNSIDIKTSQQSERSPNDIVLNGNTMATNKTKWNRKRSFSGFVLNHRSINLVYSRYV